jgi:AbrB family looped-hinge helix DNA binding protein
MGRKFAPLPRQTIQVDSRGRITIPDYLREAANLEPGSWIEVAAYPELKDMKCKGLTLRREF